MLTLLEHIIVFREFVLSKPFSFVLCSFGFLKLLFLHQDDTYNENYFLLLFHCIRSSV